VAIKLFKVANPLRLNIVLSGRLLRHCSFVPIQKQILIPLEIVGKDFNCFQADWFHVIPLA